MPIVLSKAELARIKRWTDADREEPEAVKKRELIKRMDKTSKEMTKSWPNSLENVNKRNEELRQARIAVAEQANAKFYKRYVKRRKEQQERLMFSARDTIFKNKDAPKLLLSAVIETVVQKERMEQVKFNKELKLAAAERKRKDDDDIIRKAKEWEELMAHKRQLRIEADKKQQMEIVAQANEIGERNRKEYETELNMQKIDNLKANQQIEAIKEFETQFKAAEKARIWADIDQAKREAAARRAEQDARDKMDDRLMEVLLRSRQRVEEKRRKTEKQVKEDKRRVLEAISLRLESGDAARAARDLQILEKANKEKEAVAEARHQAALDKVAANKAARLQQRQQWLQDEAAREHHLDTTLHWECMNRFKNVELYEDFKEKLAEEKARKIKEFREDTLRLWKEREDREAKERTDTQFFYGKLAEQKIRAADNKLLTHANELLEEARAHGRPDHALHKAIDRYCCMYRLYPMPDLPASLKEHFQRYAPWDGTRPDAEYVEPLRPALNPPPLARRPTPPARHPLPPARHAPPPTCPPTPPARALEVVPAAHPARDGLQDPAPRALSNSAAKKKEENIADYKRNGRANGLQRRNAHVSNIMSHAEQETEAKISNWYKTLNS